MVNKERYKIAIVAPVPFYYHTPLYQRLAKASEIDLVVYYCSDETLRGAEVGKMYQSKGEIVPKENLLEGYNYKFLRNYSPFPSYMRCPFGLINLGIWGEIRKGKYNAVVLQGWTNLTWWLTFLACLKFNTRVFLMTDSNIFLESLRSPWRRCLKKILLGRFLFKKAAGFLTSGRANDQFYKSYGVPEKKMVSFPFSWGYEKVLEKALQLKSKREKLRISFGIKKTDFVLLFVGRLAKRKSPFVLLEAYNQIASSDKRLYIVGDGPLRSRLERRIQQLKLKEIYLMGFKSREVVYDFYTIADAFILPSEQETWGIVINEAMCFGLPIIASNRVGAAVDLVKEGYNGFIFPAGDSEKLASCIEKLIHLPIEERLLSGERSTQIVTEWMNKVDPVQQMLKAIKIPNTKNHALFSKRSS